MGILKVKEILLYLVNSIIISPLMPLIVVIGLFFHVLIGSHIKEIVKIVNDDNQEKL